MCVTDEVADGDGAEPEPKDVDWFQGQPTGYESGSQLNVDLDAEGSDLGLDSPDPQPDSPDQQPDSPEPDMQESLDISHESVDGLSYRSQPATHRSNPASPRDEADETDSVQAEGAEDDPPPKSAHSGQSDKKQLAADALSNAVCGPLCLITQPDCELSLWLRAITVGMIDLAC